MSGKSNMMKTMLFIGSVPNDAEFDDDALIDGRLKRRLCQKNTVEIPVIGCA